MVVKETLHGLVTSAEVLWQKLTKVLDKCPAYSHTTCITGHLIKYVFIIMMKSIILSLTLTIVCFNSIFSTFMIHCCKWPPSSMKDPFNGNDNWSVQYDLWKSVIVWYLTLVRHGVNSIPELELIIKKMNWNWEILNWNFWIWSFLQNN